jgi:hypothetical protein
MANVLCSLLRIFCLDGVLFFVCFAENPYTFLHNSSVGKLRNVLGSKWVFKKMKNPSNINLLLSALKTNTRHMVMVELTDDFEEKNQIVQQSRCLFST